MVKKYTPCQGVVWSQYRLSGTFYVPNSIGKKIHTLPRPRCGLVTIQIVRHILCSINFWCGFVCQGVFCLPMQFCKAVDFTLALLYPHFKLQYLMNYASDFNNFCRFQFLEVCIEGQDFWASMFIALFISISSVFL